MLKVFIKQSFKRRRAESFLFDSAHIGRTTVGTLGRKIKRSSKLRLRSVGGEVLIKCIKLAAFTIAHSVPKVIARTVSKVRGRNKNFQILQ